MRTRGRLAAGATVVWLLCSLLPGGAATAGAPAFRVLLFTKTSGFRHDSIPVALAAVEQLGARGDFAVDATEDASAFTDANLARYAVVAFVLTTGDVLDPSQQAAFKRYIEAGGGFVGIHSAADTEHDWSWYGGLVGAYFKSHPEVQQATIAVADRATPSTVHLPARWARTDEWYDFETSPRGSVTVLATIDESTYSPGPDAMGADHPIMWQHLYDGGRSWYFGGGHTTASYGEPLFRGALLGGILWAAGVDLPSVRSVTTRLTAGRLTVTARHSKCATCTLRVRVRVGSRFVTAGAPARGTATRVTTGRLPPGRWTFTLTLFDSALAVHATLTHRVLVPGRR